MFSSVTYHFMFSISFFCSSADDGGNEDEGMIRLMLDHTPDCSPLRGNSGTASTPAIMSMEDDDTSDQELVSKRISNAGTNV